MDLRPRLQEEQGTSKSSDEAGYIQKTQEEWGPSPPPHPTTKASHFCGQREGANGSTWEEGWARTLRAQL